MVSPTTSAVIEIKNRPTKADLLAAKDRTVPDVISSGLKVLFCGINPGLYSAYTRHHFARPGNRFWPALFASGFTKRLMHPSDEAELLQSGYGITNLVDRATLAADELTSEELLAGAQRLRRKLQRFRPRTVAILGVTAYRIAFDAQEAGTGLRPETLCEAKIWVLPNPSGLNAHFTPKKLAAIFRKVRLSIEL